MIRDKSANGQDGSQFKRGKQKKQLVLSHKHKIIRVTGAYRPPLPHRKKLQKIPEIKPRNRNKFSTNLRISRREKGSLATWGCLSRVDSRGPYQPKILKKKGGGYIRVFCRELATGRKQIAHTGISFFGQGKTGATPFISRGSEHHQPPCLNQKSEKRRLGGKRATHQDIETTPMDPKSRQKVKRKTQPLTEKNGQAKEKNEGEGVTLW